MKAQVRSIPSLDGLRGLAVLLVVAAHIGVLERLQIGLNSHHLGAFSSILDFDAGDLGVSVFFVISGFLITTLLIRHDDVQGRISLKDFYFRRFFRIFPPYYFYLAVICTLWALHLVLMLRAEMIAAVSYTSNYFPLRLALPAGGTWLTAHTWSLSLEEQFYLFWPACLHWLGRRRAALLGIGLMLLVPLSRMATLDLAPGLTLHGQLLRMFHTRIDTIMAGCVLALLGTWPPMYRSMVKAANRNWMGVAAALLLYLDLRLSRSSLRFELLAGVGLEALLLAFLVFFAIDRAHTAGGRLLNHAALRHVGVISYSLYLWQQLYVGPSAILARHSGWRLILIVPSAEFSYWVVEKASYRVRDWWLAKRSVRQAHVGGAG